MASTNTGARGGGRHTVVGTFDGANHADQAVTQLKNSGFQPEQVSAHVNEGDEAGGGMSEGTSRSVALGLGMVLGAIVGAIIGNLLGDDTLALIIGAVIGAVSGALIASGLARAGASRAAASGPPRSRKGSVRLTVNANSAQQAGEARAVFQRLGARMDGS